MKKLIKDTFIIFLAVVSTSSFAVEGLSAKLGFVSDSYSRATNVGDGGAYIGADYEHSGFFIGAWAIDDGASGNDGLEYDLYTGFGLEHGDFAWKLGYTRYEYTYTSDYEHEANISLAFKGFGLNLDVGKDDNEIADSFDYSHAALSWAGEVLGVKLGYMASDDGNDDNDYSYVEVSASTEVSGLSLSATIGVKQDNISNAAGGQDDGYIIFDISKSFDL